MPDPSRRMPLVAARNVVVGIAALAVLTAVGGQWRAKVAAEDNMGGAILAPIRGQEDDPGQQKYIRSAQKIMSDPTNFNGRVFWRGKVDGVWSKAFSNALAAYQDPLNEWYNDDIHPSRRGILDERTYRALSANFFNSPKMSGVPAQNLIDEHPPRATKSKQLSDDISALEVEIRKLERSLTK